MILLSDKTLVIVFLCLSGVVEAEGALQARLTFSFRVIRVRGTFSLLGVASMPVVSCWMGWAMSAERSK